jgi:hypothetical protein
MKIISLMTIVLLSFSAAHAYDFTYKCTAETSGGDEVVVLKINAKNVATIKVNNIGIDVCGRGKVTGELVEYGEAKLRIMCAKGIVELKQDYDEMSLDISSLGLGLSDTTYMCD